jgi:hypothetical protein
MTDLITNWLSEIALVFVYVIFGIKIYIRIKGAKAP